MPSDTLTVAVTTGLGVSVLAGIISGICYVLTHGLPNTRPRKPVTPWHCNVCGGLFRSIQGILEVEKVVTCAKCKQKVCRVRCSKRDSQRGWICQICQQPENWFKGLLKSIHPSKDWFSSKMDPNAIDELDEDLMELRKKEREQVRDFIERLVESMLGGNLDDVSVARIYNDKKYDSLYARYHADLSNALTDLGSALHISISNLPITGQSPCSAHTILKQLIQRFSGEVADLPSLKPNEDHPAHPEETLSNRTYEDLLSTAIINKVVQSSQNEARSSTNGSTRGSTTSAKRGGDNKEYFFGEETLENKWKNHDSARDDASSVSSLDEWVRSDSSRGSSKYVDRVSLTIKQHIEEGTSSDDDDRLSPARDSSLLQASDDSWHENWYFQKRRLTNSSSPVPVPMLVPNPITEAKVFIGDKEAEQLSDIDSDYGDTEVVPDIKNILVNSKTIIGGKNAIGVVDDEVSNDIQTSEAEQKTENREIEIETEEDGTNIPVIVDDYLINRSYGELDDGIEESRTIPIVETNNEDISLISIESNTEQDSEYTEKYASLPRTISKPIAPVPKARTKKRSTEELQLTANGLQTSDQTETNKISSNKTVDTSDSSDEESKHKLSIFKGSYSEREKEKWKHPSVDIPDNPYSPENLERRLSSRSSNDSGSSIFGRDYYIKNAARSAGARKTQSISNESEVTEYSPTLDGNEIHSETPTSLVTAVPALIDTEESNEFESITDSPSLKSPKRNFNDISSDSDLSIERVYNLQSGRVFETKGNIRQEISPKESYSPEGLKYVPKEFDEDVKSPQTDENHNSTKVVANKLAFMRSLTQSDEDEEIMKNDQVDAYHVMDVVEEEEDIVPYNDSKFKATLEIFKTSEQNEIMKLEKVEKTDKTIIPKETIEIVKEPISEKIEEEPIITAIEVPKYFADIKKGFDNRMNTSDYSEEEMLSDNREFSLEYSTDVNDDDISRTESSLDADPEISDLREKRLVKGLLDIFSRNSSVNETPSPIKKIDLVEEIIQMKKEEKIEEEDEVIDVRNEEISLLTDVLTPKECSTPLQEVERPQSEVDEKIDSPSEEIKILQSVKDLKQLFDKENNVASPKRNPQQIYSLTARSLPKQFRQKLKSDDEISLQNEESLIETSPTNEEPVEVLPTDITRNMIAFYEELGNKRKSSTT